MKLCTSFRMVPFPMTLSNPQLRFQGHGVTIDALNVTTLFNAMPGYGDRRVGQRPRLSGSLCQVIAAYALILNSRSGTEGSTVSSSATVG